MGEYRFKLSLYSFYDLNEINNLNYFIPKLKLKHLGQSLLQIWAGIEQQIYLCQFNFFL